MSSKIWICFFVSICNRSKNNICQLLPSVAVFRILFVNIIYRMRAKSGIGIIATFAVLLGGIIYMLYRSSDVIAIQWMSSIGMERWIQEIRSPEPGSHLLLPQWMIYSLPNGLWALAYAMIISYIWIGHRSWLKWVWLSTIPMLVYGFEMLQYMKIVPGTFCREDLLSASIGIFLGVLIGINIQKNRRYGKALV